MTECFERVCFKPLGLRLQKSDYGNAFFLAVDLTEDTTFSISIGKDKFLAYKKLIENYKKEGLL